MTSKVIIYLTVLLIISSSTFAQSDLKKKIDVDLKKLVESFLKDFSDIKGIESYRDNDDLIFYKSNYVFTYSMDTNNVVIYDNQLGGLKWKYNVRIYESDISTSIQELYTQILEVLDNIKFSFGKLTNVGVPMAAGTADEDRPNYIYTGKKKVKEKVKELHISVETFTDENNKGIVSIIIDNSASFFRL